MMTDTRPTVTGGVDTHKDTHMAAVIDTTGRVLDTAPFSADPAGYQKLLSWTASFGNVDRIGVEGTGAYGAGLTRALRQAGIEVVEVNRPNRQARRRRHHPMPQALHRQRDLPASHQPARTTPHPGPALRQARLAAGLTQHDVATALGTHAPRISNIENHHRDEHTLTRRYANWIHQQPTCTT